MKNHTRKSLALLTSVLYEGGVVDMQSSKGDRALCFRLGGEELPALPGDKESYGANQAGVFITFEERAAGQEPKRKWLGCGSLDDLHLTLSDIGELDELMEDFSYQMSFRSAMGVPIERGFIEILVRDSAETEMPRQTA